VPDAVCAITGQVAIKTAKAASAELRDVLDRRFFIAGHCFLDDLEREQPDEPA
jgi:hypothetical protein